MPENCLYCYRPLNAKEKDFHNGCSLQFFGTHTAPVLPYSLKEMAVLAKEVVERSVAVPGVQPKLSLSLVKSTLAEGSKSRFTVVGALGGNYIFKPPSEYYAEMPQNEHLTMRIAEAFGISTVKSSLIRLKSGELAYITRRIDRTEKSEKIHMLDMYQVIGAFDKYKSSMEKIGKALNDYSANTQLDKLNFFELTLFCYLTGNNDMHLKNFSMINENEEWVLAPAYDLLNVAIVNPGDKEELALTLGGKKKNLNRENFENFGLELELSPKQVAGAFRRMTGKKKTALAWIDRSFLNKTLTKEYKRLLLKRYGFIDAHLSHA